MTVSEPLVAETVSPTQRMSLRNESAQTRIGFVLEHSLGYATWAQNRAH